MRELKRYETATAFRRDMEDRLKQLARQDGVDLQRLRRQVAFDRLLARLFSNQNAPWALKGGYAMELRVVSARTTRDIDLSMQNIRLLASHDTEKQKQAVLEALQEDAAIDLNDFFVFLIGRPILDLDAAPYLGVRYPVESRLDGRSFVKFHLDVGVGDAIIEPFEVTKGRDWLSFMGISSPYFKMIPKEQQFAEKLHAYTLPREAIPNSRVKDLVDMVLLIELGTMDKKKVTTAIELKEAVEKALPDKGGEIMPTIADELREHRQLAITSIQTDREGIARLESPQWLHHRLRSTRFRSWSR